MKPLSVIVLLLALAGLGLPAAAQTSVPFSFNLSVTIPCAPVPGNPNESECPNQSPSGTMPPFGSAEAVLNFSEHTITFTLATGATFTVLTNAMGDTTITGGTGIFASATGSLQLTLAQVYCTVGCNSVTVTLTGSGTIDVPNAPGGLTALPASLQLQAPQGSSAPVSKTLILNNQGLAAVSFTVSAAVTSKTDWLSVSPPSGSVPAASSSSIQVTASPSGMALGVYDGELNLDAGGLPVGVSVRLIVGDKGANLVLPETGASFVAALGGSSPAAQIIQVQNTGVGDLSGLTATTSVTGSEPNWLQASIAAGFATLTQTAVSVSVDPGKLKPGIHYGEVSFNLPSAANSPQSVSVQMQVNAGPPPTFQPASILFQGSINADGSLGPMPPPIIVTITNPGLEPLDYTVTVPPDKVATGLFSPPPSGSVPAGGTAQLPISISASCWGNPNCIDGPLPIPAWGAWNVNFPAINYTYGLWASIQTTGGTSSSPPIPVWGSPPPGVACPGCHLRVSSSGAGRPAISSSSTPAVCTPSVLDGMITSQSLSGFQATVGQPTPLQVTIFDNCGNNLNSGAVSATFSNGDPAVPLNPLGAGQWSATWVPSNASATATMTLQGASESGLFGSGTLSGSVAASTSTPLIDAGGIANAASGAPVIAPGAFISIYGANMAAGLTVASSTPFPDSLGQTEAFLGGQSLPLYFTSTKQINAIVPYDIAPNSSQQLIIQSGDALSQPEPVTVAAAQPGVFTQNQSGSGPGAILGQKPGKVAALNTAANPASAGDALLIFCTGLGTVTPAVAAGSAASTTVLSNTDNPVTVTVGGDNAQVLFAGLAPGFVGLYQVNVLVPTGIAAADDVPVVLTEAGATSAPVTVAIK